MEIKYKLSELELDEVSFVDEGDNPMAHIVLFKNRDTSTINSMGELRAVRQDGDDLYLTDSKGALYVVKDFSVERHENTIEVDGVPTEVVDGEYEEETNVVTVENLESDPVASVETREEASVEEGVLKRWFKTLAKSIGVSVSDEQLEKARFAEIMRQRNADAAYEESFQLTEALRISIDSDLWSMDSSSDSMKASLDEFYSTFTEAIEKWSAGQLLEKARDEEKLSKAAERNREVFGVKKQEGEVVEGDEGGDHVVDEAPQDEVDGNEKEEGQEMPVDRETLLAKLSPEERAHFEELEKKAPIEPETDIWKGVPVGLRKQFEAQQETIDKMKTEREEQEFINKSRDLSALPVNPVELGPVLRRISKGATTQDDEKFITDTLKSANELARSGGEERLGPVGQFVGKSRNTGSIDEEMAAAADTIASEKGIAREVAFGKIKSDPRFTQLVERYYGEGE